MRSALLIFLGLASPVFALMSVPGTWKGQVVDQNKTKVCDISFTITQTATHFAITDRTYACEDTPTYSYSQKGTDAEIVPVNLRVSKLEENGKDAGVIFINRIQIDTNPDEGEALILTPGGNSNILNVSEMIHADPVNVTLQGPITKSDTFPNLSLRLHVLDAE